LVLTTNLVWLLNPQGYSLPLGHPIKMIGNISGIVLLIGLTVALGRKIILKEVRARISSYDILFDLLLYLAVISGFFAEYVSRADLPLYTAIIYYLHLGSIGLLIITGTFTKFLHAIKIPILILINRYRLELIKNSIIGSGMPDITMAEKLLVIDQDK
jgi:nitrate reductase gamma subunit